MGRGVPTGFFRPFNPRPRAIHRPQNARPVSRARLFGELGGVLDYLRSGTFPSVPAVLVTIAVILALSLGKKLSPKGPMALAALMAVSFGACLFVYYRG